MPTPYKLLAGLPRSGNSGKTWKSQGIQKCSGKPGKVREFDQKQLKVRGKLTIFTSCLKSFFFRFWTQYKLRWSGIIKVGWEFVLSSRILPSFCVYFWNFNYYRWLTTSRLIFFFKVIRVSRIIADAKHQSSWKNKPFEAHFKNRCLKNPGKGEINRETNTREDPFFLECLFKRTIVQKFSFPKQLLGCSRKSKASKLKEKVNNPFCISKCFTINFWHLSLSAFQMKRYISAMVASKV